MNNKIVFEMSELEIQHSSIRTVINMLIDRYWVSNNPDSHFRTLVKKPNDFIDTTQMVCDMVDKKIAIKFYNSKLNSLKNDKEIDVFISAHSTFHKILIVNDISPKAEKQIMDSRNFEVFKLNQIVRDISKHHMVPLHILLQPEEAAMLTAEYGLKKNDMARINIDDPMAKHLYAKKDDIIMCIRETVMAGYSTGYRLVVPNSIHA